MENQCIVKFNATMIGYLCGRESTKDHGCKFATGKFCDHWTWSDGCKSKDAQEDARQAAIKLAEALKELE